MIKLKKYLLMFSIALGTNLLINTNVFAEDNVINVKRIAGQNRFETSAKVSSYGWSESYYALLCNGYGYADAVVSSPLAKKFNAPTLLVEKDSIPQDIKNELIRLKTKKVFIVGGKGVVSDKVEQELSNMGIEIEERICGQDRYETSAKMSHYIIGEKSAFFVEGTDWRNALTVSPVASMKQDPILLTDRNKLPDSIKQKNLSYQYNNLYVVTERENNDWMETQLKHDTGIPFYQLTEGYTKTDTNIQFFNTFKNDVNFERIILASSKDFPDGLCVSNIAASNRNLIYFVDETNINTLVDFFSKNARGCKEVLAIGGEASVPQHYVDLIKTEVQRHQVLEQMEQDKEQREKNEIKVDLTNKEDKNSEEYKHAYDVFKNGLQPNEAEKMADNYGKVHYGGYIEFTIDDDNTIIQNGESIKGHRVYYFDNYDSKSAILIIDKETRKMYQLIKTDNKKETYKLVN